jgi:hypothetical protein
MSKRRKLPRINRNKGSWLFGEVATTRPSENGAPSLQKVEAPAARSLTFDRLPIAPSLWSYCDFEFPVEE